MAVFMDMESDMQGREQGRRPGPARPSTGETGSCGRPALRATDPWRPRVLLALLACLGTLPVQAEPPPSAPAPAARESLSAAHFFRYQAPPGWSAAPHSPFGLSAQQKKAFGVTLNGPWRGEIPLRITATYYAEGNLLYTSVAQYLRIFAPAAPGARPEAHTRPITVSGRAAMQFERERKEFMPMHPGLGPEGPTPGEGPRVYERRGELMARAVPVRERFVVIPGKAGFHALRYSAEAKDFQEFLPDFEQLTASFEVLE